MVIWSEKNKYDFWKIFANEKVLEFFTQILQDTYKAENNVPLQIKLMQIYSLLHCNVKNKDFEEILMRDKSLNLYLNFSWNYQNDEIVFYYVNFVKSLV